MFNIEQTLKKPHLCMNCKSHLMFVAVIKILFFFSNFEQKMNIYPLLMLWNRTSLILLESYIKSQYIREIFKIKFSNNNSEISENLCIYDKCFGFLGYIIYDSREFLSHFPIFLLAAILIHSEYVLIFLVCHVKMFVLIY